MVLTLKFSLLFIILTIWYLSTNLLRILVVFEIAILAFALLFLITSSVINDLFGQSFILIIFTIAAMESAFGLGLVVYTFHTITTTYIFEKIK